MAQESKIQDASKLKFLDKYQEAGLIKIRIKKNKFGSVTKENIIKSVEEGLWRYSLGQFFTQDSIIEASRVKTEKQVKKAKENGKDSE